MANEIKVFENGQFGSLRVADGADGQPWFVAQDVCRALEIINSRDAVERLDGDEKGVASIYTPGGTQDMTVVSEAGLYALVLGSRKPEARAFKRWVTHEVIPSIRATGAYLTDNALDRLLGDPDAFIRLLTEYKQEKQRRIEAQRDAVLLAAQVERDAPKVLFADSVATSHQAILIGELAKFLRQNGVEIGQNRLFDCLRNNGYLMKTGERRNSPTQYSMELGLFEVKERSYVDPSGTVHISLTTKVTGKGQIYFVNKFIKGEIRS